MLVLCKSPDISFINILKCPKPLHYVFRVQERFFFQGIGSKSVACFEIKSQCKFKYKFMSYISETIYIDCSPTQSNFKLLKIAYKIKF